MTFRNPQAAELTGVPANRVREVTPRPEDMERRGHEYHLLLRGDPASQAALYGDVAACDLLPVLKALVARLEAGTLRMPVGHGHRWVDVPVGP